MEKNNLVLGEDFTENVSGIELEMVYVKGGTFRMGATEEQETSDPWDDEYPLHSVTLSDYYIGKFEVTQGLWEKVMRSTIEQQRDKVGRHLPLYGVGSNYPMYYVNWYDAIEFCMKLSGKTGKMYILPTEAQWEYAARGGVKGKGYKYSGSDSVEDVAWAWNKKDSDNDNIISHPVGMKQPNELGIYDMSGNLNEWCWDIYDSYGSASQTDPKGPVEGNIGVLRGGSFQNTAIRCRVSSREWAYLGDRWGNMNEYGFRVIILVP